MPKKKKKKSGQPGQALKREPRLRKARQWLAAYDGEEHRIVRRYRDKFKVDIPTALRDLQEIGHVFAPEYVDAVLRGEEQRLLQKAMKKQEQSEHDADWRDDRFFFIAGYTSGGAPYGVTWEEMGLEPYENEFDDDDAVCFRHYEHLSKWEKDSVDGKLRDSFSAYVKRRRRLPSRQARDAMIAQVFDDAPGGPILHTKEFNAVYRKLVRKRENAFIREGILPKRFSPTEIQRYLNQTVMLESDRLLFRKISAEDFEDLADMLRDPEVMAAWEHTFSDEQIQKWIETQLTRYRDHIVGYFAVIHKESGAFIGQAGLMWSDIGEVRALEVGYMLKRRYWHNGYAGESAAALIQCAFEEIGVNKVYATIRPENKASLKVARQAGMAVEGLYIKQYNGAEMEHMILSISRTPEQDK